MAIRKRVPYVILTAITVAVLYLVVQPFTARGVTDWYASASGSGTTCSIGSPCSLKTLITGGMSGEAAGDRYWVRGGTYTTNDTTKRYLATLTTCTAAQPCIVRNYNNEHVIIDANFDLSAANLNGVVLGTLNDQGAYVRFWGFDIINTSTESRLSSNESKNSPPVTQNEIDLIATGAGLINSFVRDANNGVILAACYGDPVCLTTSNHVVYGNYFQYSGYWGLNRSYGHSGYLKNQDLANASYYEANVGLRAWHYGVQLYSDSNNLAGMIIRDNIEAAAGHSASPTTSWPTKGNLNNWYLGASTLATSCGSNRVVRDVTFDDNWSWGGGSLAYGGGKGSCRVTFTDNRLMHTGGILSMTTNGTFGGDTVTGNYFYGTPDGSGGPAPTFTQANYPTNTYASSIPTTGPDVFKYVPNAYESGRGWVAVWNPDSSANVTIDPAQMGCYTGEQIKIYNWQDNNPWDSTPIATQTGCGTLSVSTTIAAGSITQPGFTTDGAGTLFPKPADLGPQMVVYFMYPDWTIATTPTPSNTPTFTKTNTPTFTSTVTPSYTPTKTFTPSQTNTPSVTPSQSATPQNTATNTPTVTPTFTPSNTPTRTPTPAGTFSSTSFDLQSCVLVAPMVTGADSTAFGGLEIHSTVADTTNPIDGASGTATCTFTVPSTALYRIWVRANSASSAADSMYVSIDGEAVSTTARIAGFGEQYACPSQSIPDEYESWWGQGWQWVKLKDRQKNCRGTTTVDGYERSDSAGGPEGVTLTAGQHTIQFINRETSGGLSVLLDYVIVTSDFSYEPNDSALTPTPTPGPICHFDLCNGKGKKHCAPPHGKSQCPWPR